MTNRRTRIDTSTRDWFEVADDPDLTFSEKLGHYAILADSYFEAESYREFCATSLASLPEIVFDWINSADFDNLLIETIRKTYPASEHDTFAAHFRGLMGLWIADNTTGAPAASGVSGS